MPDKREISEVLKKNGIIAPNTEQVIINCNGGAICDIKVVTRHK
jgi:hypothetical protein